MGNFTSNPTVKEHMRVTVTNGELEKDIWVRVPGSRLVLPVVSVENGSWEVTEVVFELLEVAEVPLYGEKFTDTSFKLPNQWYIDG